MRMRVKEGSGEDGGLAWVKGEEEGEGGQR